MLKKLLIIYCSIFALTNAFAEEKPPLNVCKTSGELIGIASTFGEICELEMDDSKGSLLSKLKSVNKQCTVVYDEGIIANAIKKGIYDAKVQFDRNGQSKMCSLALEKMPEWFK